MIDRKLQIKPVEKVREKGERERGERHTQRGRERHRVGRGGHSLGAHWLPGGDVQCRMQTDREPSKG